MGISETGVKIYFKQYNMQRSVSKAITLELYETYKKI